MSAPVPGVGGAPVAAYLDWISTTALPFWATAGFDAAAGRFHERLDLRGAPVAVPHRAMLQARQIYVFAHAAQLGWFDGGALAERAMTNLIRDFAREERRGTSFAFSIDPATRSVVSRVRDAYAHAFVLFALAALHRLNGNPKLLALADRVIAYVDAEIADPVHGGLLDAVPAPDDAKRQNPVMHLLEAYLLLERAAPGRGYRARAGALVELLQRRFLHPGSGVLLEHFSADWAPHPHKAKAEVWEPGHHFEWVWLLAEYRTLAGEDASAPVGDLALRLHRTAAAHGIAAGGRIWDELSPSLTVVRRSHRLWPHTEAIKAAVAMKPRIGAEADALADAMAATLTGIFVNRPFAAGWIDHVAPDRTPLVGYVPASSLYHLFLAATEAARIPGRT